MLADSFQEVYNLFKMKFYESLCKSPKDLTMQEAFSLDVIYMLGEPTIQEYASYMGISLPNATYKINQMVEKGFLLKETSAKDKRASTLKVTELFLEKYRDNDNMVKSTMNHIEETFDQKEVAQLIHMLEEIKKLAQEEKHD